MNRHDALRRPWLLAAMILMLAATLLPARASAQTPCPCDGTAIVDPAVPCTFEICYKYVSGFVCRTYTPGTTTNFPCQTPMTIYLKDCHGNLVELGVGKCLSAVPVGHFCCVDACLTVTSNGCLVLTVKPSPILNCPC